MAAVRYSGRWTRSGYERHLARNGTVILKFFLNVSREEQAKRFRRRIDRPDKNWKFNVGDLAERALWDDYQHAYEAMLSKTSTAWAPYSGSKQGASLFRS